MKGQLVGLWTGRTPSLLQVRGALQSSAAADGGGSAPSLGPGSSNPWRGRSCCPGGAGGGSLGPGVSGALGSDCSLADAGKLKQSWPQDTALGSRVRLPKDPSVLRRKAMEGEGLRNFKELRAKFQKFDVPSLPRPRFPARICQKSDIGNTQSTGVLADEKPLSSNHGQLPLYCSSSEPQPLQPQETKSSQRSKIQRCSDSSEPPEGSTDSAVKSQKTSLLLDVNQSNADITHERNVMVTDSFKDKLWNWEKVSSQKSGMSSAFFLASRGRRAFHLEEEKSIGLAPEEPRGKLKTGGAQTLPSQKHLMTPQNSLASFQDPTSLLFQYGRKSLESPYPERSPVGNTCQPVYESELAIQVPEKQPDDRHHQLLKTKPLPSIKSLGPPPPKPPKPPAMNLQAFQRQAAVIAKTHMEAVEEGRLPPESAEFEEPRNYEATISYLKHSGNSINLCTAKEIADSTYEVEIEELRKPWKSGLRGELSPTHEDEGKKEKEKELCELEPRKPERDLHSSRLFEGAASGGMLGRNKVMKVHGGSRSPLPGKQDTGSIIAVQTKPRPHDPKLARHSLSHGGYVEALEVTQEMPGQGAWKPRSISEETYDDVECPSRGRTRSDFSSSFASDDEENSEEVYEEVYKTKGNYPKIDLDGKEALKRLQKFLKKEKNRFKMKKNKLKENVRNEDKLKTWKPKFLMAKEKKEKKGVEESERNFFRTKKQNLEKIRMEKEEKRFREQFEYDKEITVINTAVACSRNSRNGMFDLPITPGEELQVIDTTEENLVICRNSKGKYGYVLLEHLDFKHQGWSP
uniref:SH3 domain-containing protein n=1 Tax=Felis catus TaxID=9685 RepID=A0ABI8A5I0_FELCA